MSKSDKKDKSLIKRLTLLKFELGEAQNYITDRNDEYRFAIGISLLHDTIENLFWAIETVNNVGIKDKQQSLLDKHDTVVAGLKLKGRLFDRTNISGINTIRNAYKHQGVLPNISHTIPIIESLLEDFDSSVAKIFKINLSDVSLSLLINDQSLRKAIQQVEKKFDNIHDTNTYKAILYDLGRIYFDFHEKANLSSLFELIEERTAKETGKELPRYKFPKVELDWLHIDLLEMGVTPYLYHRFKNLVPSFGVDKKNDMVIPKYESVYWAKENWTKLNAEFCLNWLLDFFLKKQWLHTSTKYSITTKTTRYNLIEPKENYEAEFHNSAHQIKATIQFKKGSMYLANFMDFIEGSWQDYDNQTEDALVVIFTKDEAYSGRLPKTLFKIKEIHLDDLNKLQKGAVDFLTGNVHVIKEKNINPKQ